MTPAEGYALIACATLGWGLRGLKWRAVPTVPWMSTSIAVVVVVVSAALWPVAFPAAWALRRGLVLA